MFVAYGSSTFDLKFGDIDLITDSMETFNAFIRDKKDLITEILKIKENHYKVVYRNIILEICIVGNDSAHHKAYKYTINKNNDSFLTDILNWPVKSLSMELNAALYFAHLILPHDKWERHMSHFQLLKSYIKHSSEYEDIFTTHRKECLAKAKKHPVLKASKDDFFKPTVGMIYDHDSIHEAIAIGDKPAYVLMKDGEVYCSKKLWDTLSEEQKTNCVQEEAGVLALERSIIPAIFGKFEDNQILVYKAYKFALYKICTTITSGWFRDECILRYSKVLERLKDYEFFQKFMTQASKGKIKLAIG